LGPSADETGSPGKMRRIKKTMVARMKIIGKVKAIRVRI
jgi:hypothetical protein